MNGLLRRLFRPAPAPPRPDLMAPQPMLEITLTLYDNQTLGFNVVNLKGKPTDADIRRILLITAQHLPEVRERPPLVPQGAVA